MGCISITNAGALVPSCMAMVRLKLEQVYRKAMKGMDKLSPGVVLKGGATSWGWFIHG